MRVWAVLTLVAALSLARSDSHAEKREKRIPKLPGAVLLVGHPPYDLWISAEAGATKVQQGNPNWWVSASMTRDGKVIASAHVIPGQQPSARARMRVATYSLQTQRWTEHEQLEVFGGDVAISPDGSKLACIWRSEAGAPSHIRVLDIATGTIKKGPEGTRNVWLSISWSPNGKQIVFDTFRERIIDDKFSVPARSIHVWDLDSGKVVKLADGVAPSWAPSGEWIAFHDSAPDRDGYVRNTNRLSVMRPDGSDHRVLATFWRHDDHAKPVWSSDSKKILVNQFRDNRAMDIHRVDVATGKKKKVFKNKLPIFAWVAAQ